MNARERRKLETNGAVVKLLRLFPRFRIKCDSFIGFPVRFLVFPEFRKFMCCPFPFSELMVEGWVGNFSFRYLVERHLKCTYSVDCCFKLSLC